MIFFGHGSSKIASEQLATSCSNCSSHGTVTLHLYKKYFHLFWIPTFPYGQKFITECSHCKQKQEKKQMPESYSLSLDSLKSEARTPWWMFSGSIGIFLLVAAVIISEKNDSIHSEKWIKNPLVGDVYHIKSDDGNYALMLVTTIHKDTVFAYTSQYVAISETGLLKMKKQNDLWDSLEKPFLKSSLFDKFKNKEIIKVLR